MGAMSEGVILMTVGMVVVFLALSLLLAAIVLLFRILEKKPTPKAEEGETPPGQAPAQPPEQHIDGQLIAILTAAAAAVLGARVRVYRVGFVRDDFQRDHSWVQQARSELHMSHKPRNY
jgi:sodium pump decarboxylase gamma subunit